MSISGPVTGDLFVDRETMLADLVAAAKQHQYSCLYGLRRTGKTSLMFTTMERLPDPWISVYFSIPGAIGVPERFATLYVGSILFWTLRSMSLVQDRSLPAFYTLSYAQREALALNDNEINRYLLDLARQLERRDIDYSQVLQMAFALPGILAQALDRPIAVFLDEFQELLHLDAYALDILGLFRTTTQMQVGACWYCLAGSSISHLSAMVTDPGSPLYGQYQLIHVGGLEKAGAHLLVERLAGQPVPTGVTRFLYAYTAGLPFYLSVLSTASARLAQGETITHEHCLAAIVDEVCMPGGTVAMHCRHTFATMLRTATQSTVAQQIMSILARHGNVTASQVAHEIGRTPPAIYQILSRLVDVDLIYVAKRRYAISDPVLAFWLRRGRFGVEANPLALLDTEKTRQRLMLELREELPEILNG
jgi:hypothetical protein